MERIAELTSAVTGLQGEASKLRREFRRRTLVITSMAVALTVAVVLAIFVQISNQRQITDNNRKLCPLVDLLVIRLGDGASTPRAQQVSRRAIELSRDFRCE